MLSNHFKIAWRNITRNKFYTGLNILGLALGLTACLLLYSYITFPWGFDRFHRQAEGTFRLVNELHFEKTEYSKGASFAMADALKKGIPEVNQSALLMSDQDFNLNVGNTHFKTEKRAALTNWDWFKLFDFKWLQGNPDDLDQPDALALTAGVAATYFGDEDPMGKIVLGDEQMAGGFCLPHRYPMVDVCCGGTGCRDHCTAHRKLAGHTRRGGQSGGFATGRMIEE